MNFTAFCDESDTHGPAPTVIIAAYLGHAYQWRRFQTKLGRLQKEHGFKIFHATDFKNKKGEFAGWSDEKCAKLISDLVALVRDNLVVGAAVALEHARFVNEYRAPPVPKKMHMDSQYGACFRGCLGYLIEVMSIRQHRDKLNIVFEGGHPNVGDCRRIFMDLKTKFERSGADILGTFTIEKKETCAPLMVADMLAHSYSMIRARENDGTLPPLPRGAIRQQKGLKGGLQFLELQPDALTLLKSGFEKMRQMEQDEWRAARAARRAKE